MNEERAFKNIITNKDEQIDTKESKNEDPNRKKENSININEELNMNEEESIDKDINFSKDQFFIKTEKVKKN